MLSNSTGHHLLLLALIPLSLLFITINTSFITINISIISLNFRYIMFCFASVIKLFLTPKLYFSPDSPQHQSSEEVAVWCFFAGWGKTNTKSSKIKLPV